MTRLLLVALLVHGLVPAFGEVVEAAVHYATTGHLAHSDADHGDLGDQGDEHGCSPTSHHCTCCAAQPVVALGGAAALPVTWHDVLRPPSDVDRWTSRSLDPPFRPPIA